MSKVSSTADEILASARRFIVAGGYNGFSYADIAAEVGIRKASIHHHFPSKVDLVRSLVRNYREDAERGLLTMTAQISDPAELLRRYAGYWGRCIEDASLSFCVCALLGSELPSLPPEVALEVRAHFRTLSGWLTDALTRGAASGQFQLMAPAPVEAEMFIASVHGAMLSARAHGDAAMFAAILQPTLRRLLAPSA